MLDIGYDALSNVNKSQKLNCNLLYSQMNEMKISTYNIKKCERLTVVPISGQVKNAQYGSKQIEGKLQSKPVREK